MDLGYAATAIPKLAGKTLPKMGRSPMWVATDGRSEQQNLTCITTYVVPMDASRLGQKVDGAPDFFLWNRWRTHGLAGSTFIPLDNHWKLHLCLCGKLSTEGLRKNADVLCFA